LECRFGKRGLESEDLLKLSSVVLTFTLIRQIILDCVFEIANIGKFLSLLFLQKVDIDEKVVDLILDSNF